MTTLQVGCAASSPATFFGRRHPELPDVPAITETGVKVELPAGGWGIAFPKGTPAPILARLAEETQKATRAEGMRKRLTDDTALPVGDAPGEFAAFIAAEQKRWKPVIERARIKPD